MNIAGPLPLSAEDGVLPGSRVLFAKVYGDPEVFDTILTRCLPELWSAWPEPPTWWFVRYQDPRPHLRLRLHLASAQDYGTAAVRVGAWGADLRRRGLAGDLDLDTYQPETPRYGSGPALTAAEALFAADSAAVLAQLTVLAAARDVHPYALDGGQHGGPRVLRWPGARPPGCAGSSTTPAPPRHQHRIVRWSVKPSAWPTRMIRRPCGDPGWPADRRRVAGATRRRNRLRRACLAIDAGHVRRGCSRTGRYCICTTSAHMASILPPSGYATGFPIRRSVLGCPPST